MLLLTFWLRKGRQCVFRIEMHFSKWDISRLLVGLRISGILSPPLGTIPLFKFLGPLALIRVEVVDSDIVQTTNERTSG